VLGVAELLVPESLLLGADELPLDAEPALSLELPLALDLSEDLSDFFSLMLPWLESELEEPELAEEPPELESADLSPPA
jgi:hypothetical protein